MSNLYTANSWHVTRQSSAATSAERRIGTDPCSCDFHLDFAASQSFDCGASTHGSGGSDFVSLPVVAMGDVSMVLVLLVGQGDGDRGDDDAIVLLMIPNVYFGFSFPSAEGKNKTRSKACTRNLST